MNIIWHGQSCFEIITTPIKNSQTSLLSPGAKATGGQVKIVIDAFSEEIGLKLPKLEADILLISHSHYDHNNLKAVSGTSSQISEKSGRANPFLISGPGEYEIKGIFVQGIDSWHDQKGGLERGSNTIYTIFAEDLKLCHLGDLGQKELTDEQLEKIGEIDILMIPVGGVFTISAKEAIKIMSQIEPKITIPMHYQVPKLKIKLDGVDKFLKSLGIKKLEPLAKLSIKKKDLSVEEAKIVLLKP